MELRSRAERTRERVGASNGFDEQVSAKPPRPLVPEATPSMKRAMRQPFSLAVASAQARWWRSVSDCCSEDTTKSAQTVFMTVPVPEARLPYSVVRQMGWDDGEQRRQSRAKPER
jgi:hypothetical protein